MNTEPSIPRAALLLGWLGVLPFVAFALMAVLGTPLTVDTAARALVLYGAIILSFMGGARWGLAMIATAGQAVKLALSVLPALASYALLFLPASEALPALAMAFVALLAYDIAQARAGAAPSWYPALRLQLTIVVFVCLVLPVIIAKV